MYKSNLLLSITHATLIMAFMTTAEYITIPAFAIIFKGDFNTYLQSDLFYFFANLISKLIHLVLCVLFLKLYNKNENQSEKKGFLLILVISFSNMALFILIQFVTQLIEPNTKLYIIWLIGALLLYISIYLVFYYRNYMIKQADQINVLNMENQKKALDEQYFSIIEKSNNDMRILAHDFKNHLIQISNCIEIQEVKQYIKKIYSDVEVFVQMGISKNKTLDIVLSKYSSLCELKKVDFKIDVKTSNLKQIEDQDLTALLNNLLDNALESAEKSAYGFISLTVESYTKQLDMLTIENSCDSEPENNKGLLITHKDQKLTHGIGLKSVRKVVEKYNGLYSWEYNEDERKFITTITLPK